MTLYTMLVIFINKYFIEIMSSFNIMHILYVKTKIIVW